jgi:hypothetical protein
MTDEELDALFQQSRTGKTRRARQRERDGGLKPKHRLTEKQKRRATAKHIAAQRKDGR